MSEYEGKYKCVNCRYFFEEEGHQGCCYGSCGNHKCIYNKTSEECLKELKGEQK